MANEEHGQEVNRAVALAEPVSPEVAQKVQAAMGVANKANQIAMTAMRAELKSQTMKGEDGRLHGPLQPCTIINLNPCWLKIGGGMKVNVPPYDWGGKFGEGHKLLPNKKVFLRGGREHVGHVLTVEDAQYWLSPGGINDHVDLSWAQATMTPRFMSPDMACWHIWREYMTSAGSAQLMGGVLIFDGDIHELDKQRLERSKGTVLVPEGYPIPDGNGRYGIKLVRKNLDEMMDLCFELQSDYLNQMSQTAYECFNSKDEMQRNAITEPMRRWGLFGVEVGYHEKADWMMKRPNANASAASRKVCPICGKSTTDEGVLQCIDCKAPYNADCTVALVKIGHPVAESYIDALGEEHYKEVVKIKREQAARREAREKMVKQ